MALSSIRRWLKRLLPGRTVRQVVYRPGLETLEDRLAPATVIWINPGSDLWDNPANWSTGAVPGPGDDAVVHTASPVTVAIQAGDNLSVNHLVTFPNDTLSITGGSLTVAANSTLSGGLAMSGGSLAATGAGVTLQVTGATTVSAANLIALGGATLSLPNLTSYAGLDENSTNLEATGTLSTLSLPNLTSLTEAPDYFSVLSVQALAGGTVDLSTLPTISGGGIQLDSDGAGSVLKLPDLASFLASPGPRVAAALQATNSGTITGTALTSLTNVNLLIDGTGAFSASQITSFTGGTLALTAGTLTLNNLTAIDGASFAVSGGATLNLPGATSYTGQDEGSSILQASGAGSTLSLPNLASMTEAPDYFSVFQVQALAGGTIDLATLPTISGGVELESDGAGSVLNLPDLASFLASPGPRVAAALQVTNSGTVTGASLTKLTYVNLILDGTGAFSASQITSFTGGALTLTAGTLTLSNLTDIDGASFAVSGGATLNLPGATSYTGLDEGSSILLASGIGSTLLLPTLASMTEAPDYFSVFQVQALAGGTIDLSTLLTISGGGVQLESDGAGSVLKLPALASFLESSGPREQATLQVTNSGTVTGASLTKLTFVNLILDGTGVFSSSQITSFTGGALTLTAGTLTLSNLTDIDGASFAVSGGATLNLPGATSYTGQDEGSSILQASGAGSTLSLPNLVSMTEAPDYFSVFQVQALAGGTIDLSSLLTISGGGINLESDGANSVLKMPDLVSFLASPGPRTVTLLQVTNGGAFACTSLTNLTGVNVALDGTGTFSSSQITTFINGTLTLTGGTCVISGAADIDAANFLVSGGATLIVSAATSYTGLAGATTTLLATGAGSTLSFAHLTSLPAATGYGTVAQVEALSGGTVDLPALHAISGQASLVSDGANSVVHVPALNSFTVAPGGQPYSSVLQVTNSGAVTGATGLTSLTDVNLVLDGTGSWSSSQLVNYIDSSLTLSGGTLTFNNLTDIDGASFAVSGGATLNLPAATSYAGAAGAATTLLATGAGSTLSLPGLSSLTAATGYGTITQLEALAGGAIDLAALQTISGQVSMASDGAGSALTVPALSSFTDAPGGQPYNSTLQVTNNGAVTGATGLTTLAYVNLVLDGTGTIAANQIVTYIDGTLTLTGGAFTLGGATDIDGSSFVVNGGATLNLPAATSYGGLAGNTTMLEATGVGSTLSLPNLIRLTGDTSNYTSLIQVEALAAGHVDVPALSQIGGGPVLLDSDGAGSVLNAPALGSFSAPTGQQSTSGLQASNTGTVDIAGGVVSMPAAGVGATISLPALPPGIAAPLLLQSSGVFGGGTTFNVAQGENVELAGGTFTGGVVFNVAHGATVDLTGGNTLTYSGTLTGSGGGTVLLSGGTLAAGAAGLAFNFPGTMFQWTGGTIQASSVNITCVGTINLAGANAKYLDTDATFDDYGALIQAGAGDLVLQTDSGSLATLKIEAGGVFLLQSNARVLSQNENAAIDNAGTIKKTGGTGVSLLAYYGPLDNTGVIEADSGTLSLEPLSFSQLAGATLAGGTWNALAGATLQFPTGTNITSNAANIALGGATATIAGIDNLATNSGSFSVTNAANFISFGAFTNSGNLTLGAASTFTVFGNYIQTGAGILNVDIGGPPASGLFGQLAVTGAATLAGGFNVTLVNGFGPSNPQDFGVMTFAQANGAFTTVTGLNPFFTLSTGSTSLDVVDTALTSVDLAASSVSAPISAAPGETVTINWQIANLSSQAAAGSWQDSVYLSATPTITSSATLLGSVQHLGGLSAGASYNANLTAEMPVLFFGAYDVLVEVDSSHQVPDPNRTNNTLAAVSQLNVSVPALTLGTPYSDAFSAADQDRYYQITVSAGGSLNLSLQSSANSGAAALYVSQGVPPTPYDYEYAANAVNQPSQTLTVPSVLTAGTYYVLAHSIAGAAATGAYTVTAAQSAQVAVYSFAPHSGANAGNLTVEIDGANLTPAVAASLSLNGTALNASALDFVSASQIFATFNLTGAAAGAYTLTVTQGAQSVPATATLQVMAASSASLSLVLVTPQFVRSGRTGTVIVSYTNETNNDVVAPLLDLTSTNPDVSFSTPDDPNLYTQSGQILAVAPSGPAGILRPGQGGQLTLSLRSNDPIDNADIPIQVGLIAANQPIDWQAAQASLQPAGVADAAWDVIFNNVLNIVGGTTQSYNAALAQAATYLSGLGETTAQVSNIGRLWAFLEAQANASYPTASLASVVDASVPAPGSLPLAIDRTFLSSLSGRYQPGIFGAGWVTSWQTSLSTDSAGNVTINRAGSPALFVLQADGTFLDTNGETGTLTNTAGAYTFTDSAGTQYIFAATSGLLTYEQDTNGNRITLGYNAANQLLTLTYSNTTDPAEPSEQLTLTYTQDVVTQIADGAGGTWTYTYDTAAETGHLLSVAGPGALTTTYAYSPADANAETANALVSITNPDGSGQAFTYDAATGRLTGASQNGANPVSYAYNGEAEVTTTDAAGDQTSVWYNDLGLASRIENPLGGIANYTYDGNGNVVSYTDAAGDTSHYTYDNRGNLTHTINPLGQTAQLTYSLLGKLTSLTDADGNKTQYNYDAAGNLLSIAYPDGTKQSFTYDPLGDLTDAIAQNGDPIAYQVNLQGLVTQKSFADGSSQSYVYDAHGNLLTAQTYNAGGTLTGTTTLSYNAADELTSIAYPGGQYLAFTYNGKGQRVQSVDQSGFTIAYVYLANGQLAELTDGSNNRIAQYTYNALGQLQTKLNGNGTSTTYTYDAAGDLTGETNYATGTTINSSFTYTYNALGEKTSMTDSASNVTLYAYDAAGELAQVTLPNGQVLTYVYNSAGDFTQVITGGTLTNYTSNADNEVTQAGVSTYTYDANGNLDTATDAGGTTTYTYNDLNQLVSTTAPDGTVTSFLYSSLGFLVGTNGAGTQTNYLVDPTGLGNITASYNGSGALNADYVYGLGLVSQTGPGGAGYYDFDGSGNTIGITGAGGAYVNRYSYLPFGATTTIAQALPNPFTFAGQVGVLGLGNGLVSMRSRVYDPVTGQFASNDPLNLHGGDTNLRRYAGNDPVDQVDPSGEGPKVLAVTKPASAPPVVSRPSAPELPAPSTPPSVPGMPPLEATPVRQPVTVKPKPATIPGALGSSLSVTSNDPNALLGPAGIGPQNYIAPLGAWSYTVDFENDGSVAAQNVRITEQLDSNLDWSTFQFGSFSFGPIKVAIPVGLTQYKTTVPYQNADGDPLNVAVAVNFNVETGMLTATFTSLDPLTGQAPSGVFDGFLPPDNASGVGEGYLQYTVQAKSGLVSGTQLDAQASIAFDTNAPLATNTVRNTIDAGYPADRLVIQAPAQALAGGIFTVTVDADGTNDQVDPLAVGSAILLLSGLPMGGILGGVTTAPLINGVATFSNLSLNLVSSNYTLTAATSTDLVGVAANIQVTAAPTIKVTLAPVTPGGTGAGQQFKVTVSALLDGRPDTAYAGTIHFTSSDAHAVLPPNQAFAQSNGVESFTVTLNSPGAQTVSVADVSLATVTGTSNSATVTALPTTTTHVALAVASPAAPIDTGATITFSVTPLNGSQTAGLLDILRFKSSDAHAVLPRDAAFVAGVGGAMTFQVTFETPGAQTVTVVDTARPNITGTIKVAVGAAPDHFVVSGFPSSDVSGAAHTLSVTAVDAYGHTVPTYTGVVSITSSDVAFSPVPVTLTKGTGSALVILTTPGLESLTASAGGKTGAENNITVVAAATHLSVGDSLTPATAKLTAGGSVTVTVTALTAAGKTDALFADGLQVTSSDKQAKVVVVSNAGGVEKFIVTLFTAGSQTIVVSDRTRPSITGPKLRIAVAAAAVSQLSVSGYPPATLGGVSHSFTVTAADPYGNRILSGFTDTVSVAGVSYVFKTTDQGAHTFTASLSNAGAATLTARDTTNPHVGVGSEAVDVISNLMATLVPPAFDLAGQATGVVGQPLPFTFQASQTGVAYTFKIDWKGNGSVVQTFNGPSGLSESYVYTAGGTYTAKLTVLDAAGDVLAKGTQSITIAAVALEADPGNSAETALAIGAPASGGAIVISAAAGSMSVAVKINGVTASGGPFTPSGHLLVYGQGGTDIVQVIGNQTTAVAIPAIVFGGSGTNTLSVAGSSADNILVGGPGSDTLIGGTGSDLLIGGAGADTLRAGSGGDLLISGTTSYDTNLTALLALLAEWSRPDRTYEQRVQDLFGSANGGLNGIYLLNAQTVQSDGKVNQLFGGAGLDWFWLNLDAKAKDKLANLMSGEAATRQGA